jgi:hypothetical protein
VKQSRLGFVAAALAGLVGPIPSANADDARAAIAVIDFDYLDTSGEPDDQQAQHTARLADFMRSLRADLVSESRFRVVAIACGQPPCTAGDTPPADLIARAKQAGARLMLFGQVHKMSTLIEWANTEIVDLAADKLIESKLFTFRGDTDEAWRRAERFIVKEATDAAPKL